MLSAENTPYISIKVSDPFKASGKFGSHIVYKITTNSNLPGFNGETSVERRYSDFDWISEQLAKDYPGIVIPALPEKETFGFAKLGFTSAAQIESRTRGLEKFLQRVAAHNQLVYSQKFTTFLQTDENGLNQIKNDAKAEKKSSGSSAVAFFESLTVKKV